jgi:hypothetical protein
MSAIDLHTHSTASDGTLTPAELVAEARRSGLEALALTDHDTTNGLEEALAAGRDLGLEVIPGCELSVDYPKGQMHIVGLWLPVNPRLLTEKLVYLRERRHSRNERIIAALQKAGIAIDYREVRDLAGEASIGRPHIARLLMDKGAVRDIQQAFDEYIGPGGRAYVPKDKLTPEVAIDLLSQEGATVILAHPFSLQISESELRRELSRLKEFGLEGMEAHYPEHTPGQTTLFLQLCREFDLLVSGGSDFHGSVKPDIRLGTGRSNLDLPYALVQTMKDRRRDQGRWITARP